MGAASVPVCPATVAHVFMSHCEAAVWGELGPFCHHTRRYFRHVGDKIGTKSHRVARARLASLRAALSSGAEPPGTDSNKQQTDWQYRPANETRDTEHIVFPLGSVRLKPDNAA